MKKIALTLLAIVALTAARAQEITYKILHECDTTLSAKIDFLPIGSRAARFIAYEYPSVDIDGKALNVSGCVLIPADVLNGTVPCDGVILYNHFTIDGNAQRPSAGGFGLRDISILLASPLKPNYIVVASDYVGYGSSSDHKLAYLCGDVDARASLNGLIAARQMLKERNIPLGKYQFNIGYSQGGSVAMAVAKLRDMEYKNKGITFDKTFVGGAMLDVEKGYADYVKTDAYPDWRFVVGYLVSVNENYKLGLKYSDIFKEPVASKIAEFIKTKDSGVLYDESMGKIDSLHQVLQPAYMDPESEQLKALMSKLSQEKLVNGWKPDTTQNYLIVHSRHDKHVPVQSSRAVLKWMKEQGFKSSIVPGKTRLQTDMVVFKLGHTQAAIVWAIQTLAAIQFWPVLYYEGEQNRYYNSVVRDLNLLKAVKLLGSLGIDLRSLISGSGSGSGSGSASGSASSSSGLGGIADIMQTLTKVSDVLKRLDLTVSDVFEMLEDSGISINDIVEVVNYMNTKPETAAAKGNYVLSEESEAPIYLLKLYEQTLANWFLMAGYDVNYNQWGWQ